MATEVTLSRARGVFAGCTVSSATPAASRRSLLSCVLVLGLLNCVFTLFDSRSYLSGVPEQTSVTGWVASLTAWLSTGVTFNTAAVLVCALLVLALPRRWVLVSVCPLVFAAIQIFVYADSVIYGLFRFHFNGMILNLLTTPGAEDTLTLGPATVRSAALAVSAIVAVESGLVWVALRNSVRLRWLLPVIGVLLAATAADKVFYAYGDIVNRVEFTRVRQLFPLYQPVTIKDFAQRHGVLIARERDLGLRPSGSTLRYPKAVVLPAQPRPLNVVIIAIESGRFDMLNPDVMPRLNAWSASQRVYRKHYSGGNASRFGIFSLLYGLDATYWHQVLAERQGPFLIHALKQFGYHFDIESCTDLNFPEFRKTAFVEVPDSIHDQWAGERVDRDRDMTSRVVGFIEQATEPFFSFMFYDASHATYIYPPEHEKFTPVIARDQVNYLKISARVSAETMRPLFNRYRNSLHYIDSQIGRVIDALERKGLLDRTLVFITGDHGEEFGELGYHTHNSTFDRYQTQVVMVAHVPGYPAASINRLTSHADIVPTILTEIGVHSPIGAYSQGLPLTTDTDRGHVVVASWDQAALIDDSATVVIGTESYNPTIEVYDSEYRQLEDRRAALAKRRPTLLELAQHMSEFSR